MASITSTAKPLSIPARTGSARDGRAERLAAYQRALRWISGPDSRETGSGQLSGSAPVGRSAGMAVAPLSTGGAASPAGQSVTDLDGPNKAIVGQFNGDAGMFSVAKAWLVTLRNDVTHVWPTLRRAVAAFFDDGAPSMGAALSFYTFFSLAPLLLIVLAVASLAFDAAAVREHLMQQISGLISQDAAQTLAAALDKSASLGHGVWATLAGVAAVLVGATTVFAELQDALDKIWRAPAREGNGLWALLRARLLSFGMILGLAFLLLVSLVSAAALSALQGVWSPWLGDGPVIIGQTINTLLGLLTSSLLFAMIFKWMPRVKVAWADVWLGAVATAILFTVGRILIGMYISGSSVVSAYGAAGTVVVVLLWVYYSAQIFLFGAEFTRAWSMRRQPRVLAAQEAERVVP